MQEQDHTKVTVRGYQLTTLSDEEQMNRNRKDLPNKYLNKLVDAYVNTQINIYSYLNIVFHVLLLVCFHND